MVRHINGSEKIIKIIKNLYGNTKCCMTIDGKFAEWRQGCLLSPTLFDIFLEFFMQEIKTISGEFLLRDENLTTNGKYTDYTSLILLIFEKSQLATNELHQACNKCGIKVNTDKYKVMTRPDQNISLVGELSKM